MPTCDYCWTPYETELCPHCEKEHKTIAERPPVFVGATGGKKGRPTLDIQEGNREQYFSDHAKWADGGDK